MNRLKKTYEKRNVTQPKMNHKSHIQHIQTLTNEMEHRASLKKQTKVAWLLW